jgi:predicted RND superfamily exporter protein
VSRRLAETVVGEHRRTVILAVLLVTATLGVAAPSVELSTSLEEFRGGTEEAAADDYVETNMSGNAPGVEQGMVVVRGDDNVLTRDVYLRQLQAQRALLRNETVNRTLHPDQRPLSLANVVAIVAIERAENGTDPEEISVEPRPPLDRQIAAVRNLSDYQRQLFTAYAVEIVLDDYEHTWPPGGGFAFVPTTYEANQKTADGSTIIVSHRDDTDPKNLTAAQVAMVEIVDRHLERDDTEAIGVGDGLIDDELRRSSFDSVVIVGPLAALLMVLLLLVTYRDLLDALLGVVSLGMVLTWTFGFMGWAGITFNQLFVAVPVLIMGLSIDYAVHVTMRYREERGATEGSASETKAVNEVNREERGGGAGDRATGGGAADGVDGRPGVRRGMAVALGGVGVAFALVTLTTATGFLSNLVSGVGPIRRFGVVSAVGIVAAFVVFGGFVPALKTELDAFLEARGRGRWKPPFGKRGGRLTTALAVPVAAARVAPWGALGVTLLVTLAAGYGASTVGTDFEQDDLLVEETPNWTSDLPPAMQPSDYRMQDNLEYVDEQDFVYDGTLTVVLVRGDVTRPDTLNRVKRTMDRANQSEVALTLPNKQPGTRSVLTVMWAVADDDGSFERTLAEADTDGDRVPDRNLEGVYDALYEAAPDAAATVVHRVDGECRAVRIKVPVDADPGEETITREIRNATAPVQGDGLRATATGQPIENQAVAAQLLDTVVWSLALTLAVVLALLMAAYRRTEGSATLGAVTLLPVALAVVWIVGTMSALGIPFNVMTAVITSFTIGIGVDYSIHVAERYAAELRRRATPREALREAVLGTGGATLGGAVTDIAGVGVLAAAILVPLQQFGVITAMTIAYSFLGSVVVLPSLLALWTRYLAPAHMLPEADADDAPDAAPAVDD